MTSVCWQVSFFPKNAETENFEDFLNDFFEVFTQNFADNGEDEYIGYISEEFDEKAMIESAKNYNVRLPQYKIEKLESENWLKDYGVRFEPFEVEDFCIFGVDEVKIPQSEKTKLEIYATTAFGSNHPTTKGCIKAISELKHNNKDIKTVLDIGTGSGILALVCAKLWQKARITASDIDEESVMSCEFNAKNNAVSENIKVLLSDGFENKEILDYAPFDLIISNIFANPLKEFAPLIANNLADKGTIILSGFLEEQKQEVIKAYEKSGLKLKQSKAYDDWQVVIMQKD